MFKLWLFYQRLYFAVYFWLSPHKSADALFRFFTSPRPQAHRERDMAALAQSEQTLFDFNGTPIQLYRWGNGSKKALLVHGWEGHAGSLGRIALELAGRGYTVWGFDAPAHGKSGGKTTNLFEFSALIARLLRDFDIRDKIITHSFGSGATVFALHQHPELCPEQLTMITSPNRYADAFTEFGAMIGLTGKQIDSMFRLIKTRFGYSPDELVVSGWIDALPIQTVQLIHDPADKIIRFDRAEKIAAASAKVRLYPLPGTGHYRILWHDDTIRAIFDESSVEAGAFGGR